MKRYKYFLIIASLVAENDSHGQTIMNGNFDVQKTIITELPGVAENDVIRDTLTYPVHIKANTILSQLSSRMPPDACRSQPGCITMTPYFVGAMPSSSSFIMLELNEPLHSDKTYVLSLYIKPICTCRSYPPHPHFGVKVSPYSVVDGIGMRVLRDKWMVTLDTIPGTVHYFNPMTLRCEDIGSFTCPDWGKHEFEIVGTGSERYIYLSIFGERPTINLLDSEKRIKKLVRRFNKSHSVQRSSKAISELRTFFPWPPDEVSDVELVFFAATWKYQVISDAAYLIDDVSIRVAH